MNAILGHVSALHGYTRIGTTCANETDFGMNHSPGAGLITCSADLQSSILSLCYCYSWHDFKDVYFCDIPGMNEKHPNNCSLQKSMCVDRHHEQCIRVLIQHPLPQNDFQLSWMSQKEGLEHIQTVTPIQPRQRQANNRNRHISHEDYYSLYFLIIKQLGMGWDVRSHQLAIFQYNTSEFILKSNNHKQSAAADAGWYNDQSNTSHQMLNSWWEIINSTNNM